MTVKRAPAPRELKIDYGLCSEIERLMDGSKVHTYAALLGAYREAVADYRKTGDKAMAALAQESERELRKVLAILRDTNTSLLALPIR